MEYLFFPVGKYEYLYNPKIDDLYSVVDGEPSIYDVYIESDTSRFEDDYEYKYGENTEGTWYYLGADTGESYKEEAAVAAAEAEGTDTEDMDELRAIEDNLQWIPDLELEDYIHSEQEDAKDEADNMLSEWIDGYRKTNLGLAMKKNVEIMFRCKSYYLVDKNFEPMIEDHILKDKPMKFNPKQKGLPFYRDPDWRKGGQVELKKGDPFTDVKDWKLSGMGMMKLHPKYKSLSRKAKKGYQLPDSLR